MTVSELIARQGIAWPDKDPDDEPRHRLVEAEPAGVTKVDFKEGTF